MKKVVSKTFLSLILLASASFTSCFLKDDLDISNFEEDDEERKEIVQAASTNSSIISEEDKEERGINLDIIRDDSVEDEGDNNLSESEEDNPYEEENDKKANIFGVKLDCENDHITLINGSYVDLFYTLEYDKNDEDIIYPDKSNLVVNWVLTQEDIVEIIPNTNFGRVNALSVGNVGITLEINYKDQVFASQVLIQVKDPVSSIEMTNTYNLVVGERKQIEYSILPITAYDVGSIQIGDNIIASLETSNGNYYINGLKEGSTTLTIACDEIAGNISSTATINVSEPVVDLTQIYDLVEEGDSYSIWWYNGVETNLTLPSEYNDKPITFLGDIGFDASNIIYFKMPSSYTGIDDNCECFRTSESIETFIFSDNIVSIPDYFLQGCTSLTTLFFPSKIESVGICAFDGLDNLTDIYFAGSENDYRYLNKNESEGNSVLIYGNPNITFHYNVDPNEL